MLFYALIATGGGVMGAFIMLAIIGLAVRNILGDR